MEQNNNHKLKQWKDIILLLMVQAIVFAQNPTKLEKRDY
jgi:hypothetical protein